MPGAVIVADQTDGAGPGTPGVAREDLWLGKTVTLMVGTSDNGSYLWELLAVPPGSAAVLSSEDEAFSAFDPDAFGTYRVRLTTNGGGPGNTQVLVFRVRFDEDGELLNRGWALPAFRELAAESNYGGNARGYAQVFESILADLRAVLIDLEENGGGGGGGPELEALQEQVDDLTVVVTDLVTDFGGLDATLATTVSDLTALTAALSTRVVELPLAAGQFSDSLGTWTRAGARTVDLSKYPPTLGGKTRQVRFFAVFENSGSNVGFATEARLFNYTNAEAVTSSALTNSADGTRTVPVDRSTVLVEGTTAGTLRTNAAALYEVQFRANGTITPPNDRAVLSSARLEISYVTP